MAEIILPPEENEETPQVPELNIDKPTENSKVITIEFEAKKTNKVSAKDTNQQLYTTDTDAWFEFKETTLEGANGTYSVVFRNRHDGSIFQRTGDVVDGVAYYKIPEQEIRHAGKWRGQLVYTLENGNTTAREFGYDVKGHILDGKDVREIVVEDFETLMSQLRSMKDNAEVELADLVNTANQNETDRQAFFDDLVEDIDELQANYQELLDTGVLQTSINTKLEVLEEEYAPKLTEVTAQLAQKVGGGVKVEPEDLSAETLGMVTGEGGPINIESVPQDYSVTPKKTNFMSKDSQRNLFNGEYVEGHLFVANLSEHSIVPVTNEADKNSRTAVIKVEPNTDYSFKLKGEHNSLRVVSSSDLVPFQNDNGDLVFGELLPDGYVPLQNARFLVREDSNHRGEYRTYSFRTSSTDNYVYIMVSNEGKTPDLFVDNVKNPEQVKEEVINESHIEINDPTTLSSNVVTKNHASFIYESPKQKIFGNLFDGEYVEGHLFIVEPNITVPVVNGPNRNSRTAVIEVKPNSIYNINIEGAHNILRVGTSNTEIPFQTDNDDLAYGQPLPEEYSALDNAIVSEDPKTAESRLETINTGENAHFLYIQVSTNGRTPKLTVEGDGVGKYKKTIDDELISISQPLTYRKFNTDLSNNVVNRNAGTMAFLDTTPGQNLKIKIEGGDNNNRFRVYGFEGRDYKSINVGGNIPISYNFHDTDDSLNELEIIVPEGCESIGIYLHNIEVLSDSTLRIYEPFPNKLEEFSKAHEDYVARYPKEPKMFDKGPYFMLGYPPLYSSENNIDPTGMTTSDIMEIYLEVENSEYLTKNTLGADGLGNNIYEYVIDKPRLDVVNASNFQNYDLPYNERHKAKILLMSGVHGDEKGACLGMAIFIRELLTNMDDKALRFIRNNATLKVIPVLNPSGMDAGTRQNHNGIDLNRNYTTKSQEEVKISTAWIDDNDDAVAMLDYHNNYRTISFWPSVEHQIYHELFYAVMGPINEMWIEEGLPVEENIGELITTETKANGNTYAHNKGMIGLTVEAGMHSSAVNSGGTIKLDAQAVKYGNDLLVNTIITIMEAFR